MTRTLWYLGCVIVGLAAGSHSGFWGGLAVLIVGIPVYFMLPPAARRAITERDLVIGGALMFALSAAYYPVLGALGLFAQG